uniref:BTB domain-containing protein n=1 Tax=Caenorhabditis tropicalis TaxID=1561998 RepID=A0A1I7T070_9PELO
MIRILKTTFAHQDLNVENIAAVLRGNARNNTIKLAYLKHTSVKEPLVSNSSETDNKMNYAFLDQFSFLLVGEVYQ